MFTSLVFPLLSVCSNQFAQPSRLSALHWQRVLWPLMRASGRRDVMHMTSEPPEVAAETPASHGVLVRMGGYLLHILPVFSSPS